MTNEQILRESISEVKLIVVFWKRVFSIIVSRWWRRVLKRVRSIERRAQAARNKEVRGLIEWTTNYRADWIRGHVEMHDEKVIGVIRYAIRKDPKLFLQLFLKEELFYELKRRNIKVADWPSDIRLSYVVRRGESIPTSCIERDRSAS